MTPLARQALACLDLTRLDDACTEADVDALCQRACTPFGPVAAVCVWPRFVARARARVPAAVRVAAVANFPAGGTDVAAVQAEVGRIADAGGDEVDLVLPWRALRAGDLAACARLVAAARRAAGPLGLKVILETGELATAAHIAAASRLALAEGADFLKTSTGRVPVGATPQAAAVMLAEIAADPAARHRVGFKASGGVRTLAEAAGYLQQVAQVLGTEAVTPARCRLGASALLDELLTALAPAG
ncbi:deoxyribose-phosphate aldolase [Ideonella sp.]|uniref:deoxyribose-phosphate aldolase n=1 Tax=Ideonella sp. TaxID=1929293 RepID=UPI0035B3C363